MIIKFEQIDELTLTNEGDNDLLSKLNSLRNADVKVLELVVVDKMTAMRLDLFCQAYYGTVNDLELFLEINGIVNPFEEPIGKILILPDMSSLRSSIDKIDLNLIVQKNENSKLSPDNISSTSNRKNRMDMTRTIGFRKMENGNLIF